MHCAQTPTQGIINLVETCPGMAVCAQLTTLKADFGLVHYLDTRVHICTRHNFTCLSFLSAEWQSSQLDPVKTGSPTPQSYQVRGKMSQDLSQDLSPDVSQDCSPRSLPPDTVPLLAWRSGYRLSKILLRLALCTLPFSPAGGCFRRNATMRTTTRGHMLS